MKTERNARRRGKQPAVGSRRREAKEALKAAAQKGTRCYRLKCLKMEFKGGRCKVADAVGKE